MNKKKVYFNQKMTKYRYNKIQRQTDIQEIAHKGLFTRNSVIHLKKRCCKKTHYFMGK